jgi:UDP-galactopyranose mutase
MAIKTRSRYRRTPTRPETSFSIGNQSSVLNTSQFSLHETNQNIPAEFDLLVLTHLRWNLVFQRPQHLMTRWGQERRVFYIEEPILTSEETHLDITNVTSGVQVIVPYINEQVIDRAGAQRLLIDELFSQKKITRYMIWYITPMALDFSRHLRPSLIIYDCMDELTGFAGAPNGLKEREQELLARADVVFTGGQSLFEAKQNQHHNIHPFPSSIEVEHFRKARNTLEDPADQKQISHPRVGFAGVIDERMDIELLEGIAREKPDWSFVMLGPVVKIDPAILPRHGNIHYLGRVDYQKLPSYFANWSVAILPFARNEATRYISPTKTPEYLAAGKPVVSTSIRDVVRPYGDLGLVHIADDVPAFSAALEAAFRQKEDALWLKKVDELLSLTSWDKTCNQMNQLLINSFYQRRKIRSRVPKIPAAAIQQAGFTYENEA